MKKHLLMLLVAVTAASMSLKAQTIIIDDGFENGIQDSVWTQEFVRGNTPWMVEDIADGLSYPATVKQGSKRAYLRNTTGETQGYVTRLVSRVMDLSPRVVYQPQLSFWYANPKWAADRDTLRVLYRTSPNARWKRMAEYSTASSQWQRVNLELPEVNETYQIAFEGTDNLGRGIVLDSVKLRSAPECTVPHDIVVTNKGANKVNIAWVASWDAYYYEMIVCKDTIDPNMIDDIPEDSLTFHGLIDGLQQNYDLTLESGEFYLVYLRSICENETSMWSSETSKDGPYGFRVRKTKQVPYFYNFTVSSDTPDKARDPEWVWGGNTGNKNPYINTTASASQRAYYSLDKSPCVVFSGANNSPTAVIPAGKYVYLATPALTDTTKALFSLNQCQVHFWSTVYTYTGRTYARSLMVGVMTDPEDITTFVPVDTVSVWGSKTFQENIVDLGSYSGHGVYVAFVSDFDRQNLFYIDDVSIEYRPAVNKVTEISVNPRDVYADIAWEGNASSYDVLVTNVEVADPSNPDADAIVAQATVNTNSYHCVGLEADHSWNRPYYVYVKAAGTEWSYRYPFVTIASARDIPYSFDFETSSGQYKIGTAATYYPVGLGIFSNAPQYPQLGSANVYRGSRCLFLNKVAGADAWVTLPIIENLDTVQVKFFMSGNATYSQAHASLGVMTNPMDINTFHKVADFKLNTTGYTMCYANFENYNGPEGVIAIVWDDVMNMSKNTINYIDELRIERLSECVPPANVQLDAEPDSLTVTWDASASASMWEVVITKTALTTAQKDKTFAEIKALGSVVVADTVTWDNPATAPVFGFGGLASHTDYYFYVRTVCGYDAAWWTEMTFSTPCPNYGFPFKETFETYSINATSAGCWLLRDYVGTGYPKIYSSGTNKCLELYSAGSTNRSLAMMPAVEGNLSDMLLSFDARSFGYSSVLYVGTMGDINDYSTFVPFDTIYCDNSGVFRKYRLNLADYDLVNDNIVFTSGVGALKMNSDMLIDNVELKDASCQEAYNIRGTIEADVIDFSWDGVSANGQWEIRATKGSEVVLNNTVINVQNYKLTGLTARTEYNIYIRPLCGDSAWVVVTAKTDCDALNPAVPNKETFDSYSTSEVPDCWTFGAVQSDYPTLTGSSNKYISIRQTSTAGAAKWAASPTIRCDSLAAVSVTFSLSTYNGDVAVFGVMTDPNDLSTFVPLDSMSGTGEEYFRSYSYDLSEYAAIIPASAKHVAWRGRIGIFDYLYIDNVSFSSVLCPSTKPSYSDLTDSSVRIASGLRSNDNEWQLLITTAYINPDSLISATYTVPDSLVVFNELISDRSKTVTGLESSKKYYVSTAAFCDSIFSSWNTLSFYTLCAPVTPKGLGTITFSEEDGYVTGSGASSYLPCWNVGSKTPGVSSSYIPYVDNTSSYKHNGHNYLQIQDYVSGTTSMYVGAYAIMPELAVGDTINKYQVSFWGRGYSSYNSQIIVGVISDPSDLNTFVAVDTVTFESGVWNPYSVGFDNYDGDFLGDMGRNIMFLSEFGVSNYAYISEVSVELIPMCRPVSTFTVENVTENSADVSWKGYQDTYRLLLSDIALTEEEKLTYDYLVDSIVDHSDNIHLTGLKPASNYYVYAQGICGEGDSTSISMLYGSIRTDCPTTGGAPVPFYDDFESYPTGRNLGCWVLKNDGTSYYPTLQEVSSSGTKAVELWSYSGGNALLAMPKIDANLEDLLLAFDARAYSSYYDGTLVVGSMSDPNDMTTFVTIASFPQNGSTDFTHYELTLADYDLVGEYIAFTSGLAGMGLSSSDVYLDNVSLTMESTCHAPKLKSLGTTSTTAHIQLQPSKAEDSLWEYAVITDSVYNRTANIENYLNRTAHKIETDTVDIILTGLQPASSYYIYARTACGDAEGYSPWIREPLKITTQFYFKDSYFFGFEKSELWERSTYSASDSYYIHPALETGRDTLGNPTTTYSYYPYSLQNTASAFYAHTDVGALCLYSSGNYHGGYVIFPVVDEPKARSFSFAVRPGFLGPKKNPVSSYNGVLEIGTIEKNTNFDTYEVLAYVRLDSLKSTELATDENDNLFLRYTLDIDSATIAKKQLVLHAPKQPSAISSIYIDDVQLAETTGVNLVSINSLVATGEKAEIEFAKIGKPWNLYIAAYLDSLKTRMDTVASFLNLTESSYSVPDLDERTDYVALLENADTGKETPFVTTTKLDFRTLCRALEPDISNAFIWDFDDPYDWEKNDVLAGAIADTAYFKPACFTTGVTYNTPFNGYQWLIQEKGYDYAGALGAYADRHYETGRNDSRSLRVYTTDQFFNSYIVLPELNCDFDSMMLAFYGRPFANYDESYEPEANRGKIVDASYLGGEYSHSIVVGTLSDPRDFSTLQILDTLTYRQTNLSANANVNNDTTALRYWELMQLPLNGAKGKYIVLFQPAPGLFFIDDLAVLPVGNTLFAPSGAHTVEVAAATADIAWNAKHPSFPSVVVLLDAAGEAELSRDTVAGATHTLTGLTPGTSYQWYVYQTDGANNSQASLFVPFATECVTITPAYTCGFELGDGWSPILGNVAYKQSLCWTYGDAAKGTWSSASYDPLNQANTDVYSYSRTDSFAVAMKAQATSSAITYQPYIALPAMDVTAYDTLQITFWMRPAYVNAATGKVAATYTGATYAKSVVVGTMTDPTDASTFVPVDTVTYDGTIAASDVATTANNRLYQRMRVALAGATGPYIAIMTSFCEKGSNVSKTNDCVWIDDIAFSHVQECADAYDLTEDLVGAHEAVLSWQADDAQAFILQVSTDPFFGYDTAFAFNAQVSAAPYRVEGLQPMTTYYYRVQSVCAAAKGEGSFSKKSSFTTFRSPYFLEEFTKAVSTSEWTFSMTKAETVVDSTASIVAGNNSYGFTRNASSYGLATPHYVAVGFKNNYHWMITPNFYLPENDSAHFSMDLALTACNTTHAATMNPAAESDMYDDYFFMIIVSEDGGKTWKSENILDKWQNTNLSGRQLRDIPANGERVRYSLAKYAGKNIRIGLYREAVTEAATGVAIHVDNVRLAFFDKRSESTTACQYEDIQIGDIYLSGDDTEPGIHSYPTCFYAANEAALAGERDSVYALEVEVFPTPETFFADTICQGETYTNLDFIGKDKTGIYRRKLQTAEHGCDSIVTLNLYVTPRAYAEELIDTLCQGETLTWNGKVYNRAGLFRDTLVSAAGCDSIETLVLSYFKPEDTLRIVARVKVSELPYSYVNDLHPYLPGEAPIYYATGTPSGKYVKTVNVQGEHCPQVLIHTLFIDKDDQGIDDIELDGKEARKIIYRDNLYIILNEEWYNAEGKKVSDPRR